MSNIPLENLIRKLKQETPNNNPSIEQDDEREESSMENYPSTSKHESKNIKSGRRYSRISNDSLLRFATRFIEGDDKDADDFTSSDSDMAQENNQGFPNQNIESEDNKIVIKVKTKNVVDSRSKSSDHDKKVPSELNVSGSNKEENGYINKTSHESDHETGESTVLPNICSKKNETVVVIDSSVSETERDPAQYTNPSGHLEYYMEAMHYLGVGSYRREEYENINESLALILKLVHWIFISSALIQALRLLKRVGMEIATTTDLKYCVKFGFNLTRCFIRYFFIKLGTFSPEKLSVMLLQVRSLSHFKPDRSVKYRLAIAMCCGSLVLTILKVTFGYDPFDGWSFYDSLQRRAYFLSETIFAWSPRNYNNLTQTLLNSFYYSNVTTTHVIMGLVDCFFDFCGTLQGEIIRNILFLAAVTMYEDANIFYKRLEPQLLTHPNVTDPTEVDGCIRHYKGLKQANSAINGTFNTTFKFVVIQNLLLYAYLFVEIYSKEQFSMTTIHITVDTIQASVLFYVGMKIYWMNENIKKWLHLLSAYNGPVNAEKILGMSVSSAITDLRDDPIGLGGDYFIINESFLVGFFASVCTIISFLVESQN